MYILGLHTGHNATAALLKDGKVIACVSEERFLRKKNFLGFPKKAIAFVLEFAKISIKDVDKVMIASKDPRSHMMALFYPEEFVAINRKVPFNKQRNHTRRALLYNNKRLAETVFGLVEKKYKKFSLQKDAKQVLEEYARLLGVDTQKIEFVDHHRAHALSTCFNLPTNRRTLILTLDGEGDDICASVNVFDGTLKRVASTPKYKSLGWLYNRVTVHLGMKGNEHEFKVMGLAPYAKEKYVDEVYQKLKKIIYLDSKNPLVFDSAFPTPYADKFLEEHCYMDRFDNLAGGVQKLTEELILEWTRAALKKTKTQHVAVAGGVFMNVKATMRLSEIRELKSLFVMPSAADESLVFGACYEGYMQLCKAKKLTPKPHQIEDLYLGKEFSEQEIKSSIKKNNWEKRYIITRPENVEAEVAKLLASGKVVARFNARSEWGARALGNRSILAHPGSEETIRIINEMIKDRDFWMPFTPSMLPEGEKKYFLNPKNIFAPYMAITFNGTELAQKDLKAAMHPYDFTIRPQIVLQEWNPTYHTLLKEFEKITGISGILNTSFNLHGEPNVDSPEDAVRTVDHSGIEFLAMGRFLFQKKN